jgi:hypothetical protein
MEAPGMTALTNRRELLSFGGTALAVASTAGMSSTLLATPVAAVGPSAFAIGHARYLAAEARLNNSTGLTKLEEEQEEDAYIAEWRAFKALRPSTLEEFAQAFLVLTDGGISEVPDDVMGLMVADARRLIGVRNVSLSY